MEKLVEATVPFYCEVIKEIELPLVGSVRVEGFLVLLCFLVGDIKLCLHPIATAQLIT